MKLIDYRKRVKPNEWAEFALAVGTTVGHLNNVAYGLRIASAALARRIADVSKGDVAVWETRPEDWHLIWPELIGAEGAPLVDQQETRDAA